VLEHVAPPLDAAFRNLFHLLKPAGVLLVTVPYTLGESAAEHFPKLHDYGLARLKDGLVLVNRTPGGKLEVHENLVFHGGPGFALELRVLTERELRRQLRVAGFRDVRFYADDAAEWGIAHSGWSLPFSAHKEPFALPLSSAADWARQWQSALEAIRGQRAEISALQAAVAHVGRIEADLAARTEWGNRLDAEVARAAAKLEELEREVQTRTEWAQSLEKQLQERTEWALSLERDLAEHVRIAQSLQRELAEVREQLERANAELEELRHSRAVRVGRKLGLS
jgi:Skp family chaperone for outer membrane proteins